MKVPAEVTAGRLELKVAVGVENPPAFAFGARTKKVVTHS